VDELAARGQYEEAITLHAMCATDAPDYVRGIDIGRLHSTAADGLRVKGDFDKAVKHYIDGGAEFVGVIRHFPDFVPQNMHAMLGIQVGMTSVPLCWFGANLFSSPVAEQNNAASPGMKDAVLQRAATAVVHFCDYHRPKVQFASAVLLMICLVTSFRTALR
jgi:hypothetical protein